MTETLSVEIARGHEAVAALRPLWDELPRGSITADFDHFHAVIESEPSMLEPWVLVARRGHDPVALLLGRLEEATIPLRIGYLTLAAPRVRSLTIVYRGVLGSLDDEISDAFVRALLTILESRGADVVTFRRLDLESPLCRAALTTPGFLERQHRLRAGLSWERTLPSTFEGYLASVSKSTRASVTRYGRKLEREFEGRMEVHRFTKPEQLDEFFRDAEEVASRTYQRGLGVGVRDDPAQRRRARLALEKGWFRAVVLRIDGRAVAFCGGEAYGDRFIYGIPGYDPAFRDHRVGTYVLMKLVADLCEDPSVSVLDFGFGDAEYKRRFGDRSWREADIHVFARRPRPVALSLARTTVHATNDALTRAAGILGVLERVKRRWRRGVASSNG